MPLKEKQLAKPNSRKSRITQIFASEPKSDLLELHALNLGLIPISEKEYSDSKGNKFIKTPLGFQRVSIQNLKTENYVLKTKLTRQDRELDVLKKEMDRITERKSRQQTHLLHTQQEIKKLNKQIGSLNRLLKEAIDRNISFDKKIVRLQNQQENLIAQNEKLKTSREALIVQNKQLVTKIDKLKEK